MDRGTKKLQYLLVRILGILNLPLRGITLYSSWGGCVLSLSICLIFFMAFVLHSMSMSFCPQPIIPPAFLMSLFNLSLFCF